MSEPEKGLSMASADAVLRELYLPAIRDQLLPAWMRPRSETVPLKRGLAIPFPVSTTFLRSMGHLPPWERLPFPELDVVPGLAVLERRVALARLLTRARVRVARHRLGFALEVLRHGHECETDW